MGLGVTASTTSSIAGRSLPQHQVLDPPTSHKHLRGGLLHLVRIERFAAGIWGEGRNLRRER